jgi:hypothetical protein
MRARTQVDADGLPYFAPHTRDQLALWSTHRFKPAARLFNSTLHCRRHH